MASPGEQVSGNNEERHSAEGSPRGGPRASVLEPRWERPVIWVPPDAPTETIEAALQLTRQFQTLPLYEKYIFT